MTSRPGWTVRPISIPDSLDSPDAWVLHGLVAVQREVHEASWGHADLHLPAEMRLASIVPPATAMVNATASIGPPSPSSTATSCRCGPPRPR